MFHLHSLCPGSIEVVDTNDDKIVLYNKTSTYISILMDIVR